MPTGNSGLYKGTKGAKKATKEEAKIKKVKKPKVKVEKDIKEEAIKAAKEEVKKPVKEIKPKKETKKADVKEEFCEGIELEGELLKLFLNIDATNINLDTIMAASKSKLKELIFGLINARNSAVLFMDSINGTDKDTKEKLNSPINFLGNNFLKDAKKKLDGPINVLGNNILRVSNMITALQGVSRIISNVEGMVDLGCLEIDED